MIKDEGERTSSHKWGLALYRPIIGVFGVAIWFVLVLVFPSAWAQWVVICLSAFFFALLLAFPIDFFNIRFSLTQIPFLGVGIVFGPQVAAWAALIGVAAGSVLRVGVRNSRKPPYWQIGIHALYELGLVLVPFAISNALVRWSGRIYPRLEIIVLIASLYVLSHIGLILMGIMFANRPGRPTARQMMPLLILSELLALPFLIISILAAPYMRLNTLVILGGVPAILSIFLHDAQSTRRHLERRIQDLSLLDQFGAVVRHATDLESLLDALHTQTTDVLGVGNFYIALYNPAEKKIWYPIAVKEGARQEWEARPITNRLTDQVIEQQSAILLVENIDANLKQIGAPATEGELQAWLGVPLTTPEGLQGCLAVFSETPGVTFTTDDQILLAALSGQVSAALENILRLAQTGETLSRQAEQLNILDQIGRQFSATLQADELFHQILQFALDFTHSPLGCISVRDVRSNDFSAKAQVESFGDQENVQALIQRVTLAARPEIVPELEGGGSQLCVPILYQNEVIGAVALQSRQPEAYAGNEMEFISQLAQQAALAMRNASLYEEVHHRLREQSMLYLVSARLVGDHGLEDVLISVSQSISASLNSQLTGVYLWSAAERKMTLDSTMVRDEALGLALPEELVEAQVGDVLNLDQPGPHLVSPAQMAEFGNQASDQAYQLVVFPLQVSGELLGMAASYVDGVKALTAEDLQLPAAIAAQGASAIQNALLFNRISEAHDRLQAVLNTVDDGVVMVDASGKVILLNNPIMELAGLPAEAMVGKPLDSISESFLQAFGLTRKQAAHLTTRPLKTPQELSGPYRYPFKDSYYERYSAPVWGDQDQILGWVLVARDITAERLINQTREMLTETLVHDLRSPLGAIKTTLDLLAENISPQQPDSVISQALDIAHRSANRVLDLVNSLMNISHLESDQVELDLRELDAVELVNGVLEELRPLANEDHVMLSSTAPEGGVLVRADRELIQRVLINLLDNAIKFTPEGGLVKVFVTRSGEKALVTVTDTGPGIPAKYRQDVFSRFVQVPGARGRRRGAGLGLAFCQVAMNAHDERIWIEDSPPDEGVRVSFTLPLVGMSSQLADEIQRR